MFTFNLPATFVNGKSAISTDIYRYLQEMYLFKPIFSGFQPLRSKERAQTQSGTVGGRGVVWLEDRCVERVDQGRRYPHAAHDFFRERGFESELGWERCMYAPVFCAQKFTGSGIGGEAFGHAGEGLGINGEEVCAFGLEKLLDGGAIGRVVRAHPAAEGEELLALRHVDASGKHDLLRADLQIEAAAGGLLHAAPRPPGGEVGFVGELVFAEADVTIDAHGDLVRWADVFGCEVFEGGVDLVDESEHGCLERALVDFAAGFEPFAVVVAGEAAEELEGLGREVRGHGSIVRLEGGRAGWSFG